MIHTEYSSLTDEELIRFVMNKGICTSLEAELAQRLAEVRDTKQDDGEYA